MTMAWAAAWWLLWLWVWLGIFVPPAHAAVRTPIRWTWPCDEIDGSEASIPCRGVAGYALRCKDGAGAEFVRKVFVDSTSSDTLRPGLPGDEARGWVIISESGVPMCCVLYTFDASGNVSGPSNPWVMAVGTVSWFPDTSYVIDGRYTVRLPRKIERGLRLVEGPGFAPIVQHLEAFQGEYERHVKLCRLFGFACRRGVRDYSWCPQRSGR